MIELIMIAIFIFYSNSIVVMIILISFLAIFFVDGIFMIMAMISWPIILVIIIILGIMLGGLRFINASKVVYVVLISIITPVMLYLYLLLLSLCGLVMVVVVSSYFSYWVICANIIVIIVGMYLLMDVNLLWLGVLPLLIFFQNQNIVIYFFMLNVIWFY